MTPNHSIQRMGASRSGQCQFERRWRLAPTADAERSTNHRQPESIKGAT
jgi:hypothetical protein